MITEEDVRHIAKLSRIDLNDRELKDFQVELSSILDYFNKLKKINTSSVQERGFSANPNNVTRKDKAIVIEGDHKKIIALVPRERDNFVQVKNIL